MPEFGLDEAIDFLTREGNAFFKNKRLVKGFGALRLPKNSAEAIHCTAILNVLTNYVKRKTPRRPLSIAVFGPPGSGKSLTVKQLAKVAGGIKEHHEINLSQLNEPRELGHALLGIFSSAQADATRMVFFDEFDSALANEPLGWLRWFLSPMQDGVFSYDGKSIAIGKTVFVFAGGTADSLEDFERRHEEYFRRMKGPDFVSRLRGFINIEGLNTYGPHRTLRRALVLHHQLGQRLDRPKDKQDDRLKIDPSLVKRLLAGAHYIHGARSLEALLDMCDLTGLGNDTFSKDHLPLDDLMKLHVSRGELDGQRVGISAGQDGSSNALFEQLAKKLFERGANVAHGGELLKDSPLKAIVDEHKRASEELVKRLEKRITNLLPYPSYLRPEVQESQRTFEDRVEFVNMTTLSNAELQRLRLEMDVVFRADEGKNDGVKVTRHLAWAISLFRMRLRLAQEISALVVIGGKLSDSWGRFPGVLEEVMLALAFKRPVYVLGMAGGAAAMIGHTMGLSAIQRAEEYVGPASSKYDKKFRHGLTKWSHAFEVPASPGLPTTLPGVVKFFRDRALGTDQWPGNGLTPAENRALFDAKSEGDGCRDGVDLIVKGISRLKNAS